MVPEKCGTSAQKDAQLSKARDKGGTVTGAQSGSPDAAARVRSRPPRRSPEGSRLRQWRTAAREGLPVWTPGHALGRPSR
jgi:hypothetical protein